MALFMRTVSIKVCSEIEGEYARGLLAESGIRAVILPYRESALAAIGGETGTVEVLVSDADADRARAILDGAIRKPPSLSMAEASELVERELMRGEGKDAIAARLAAYGWPMERAYAYIADKAFHLNIYLKPDKGKATPAGSYRRQIWRGLISVALGAVLAFLTFSMASFAGGFYLVFLGPLVWGLYELVSGIIGWLRHR